MSFASTIHRAPSGQRSYPIMSVALSVGDWIFGGKYSFWYALIVFLALWGLSIATFGVPGLYLPAVALVPVIFGVLFLITRG